MSAWNDPVGPYAKLESRLEDLEAEVGVLREEVAEAKYSTSFTNISTLMALPCDKRIELVKKLLVGTSEEGRIK